MHATEREKAINEHLKRFGLVSFQELERQLDVLIGEGKPERLHQYPEAIAEIESH